MRIRTEVRIEGTVQGVGFRPFVHGLATRLGLAGLVGNDTHGVFIEVEGDGPAIDRFLRGLSVPPPLAVVDRVVTRPLVPRGDTGFSIVGSDAAGPRRALVSFDSATCADCLREMRDPADRRHGYAFVNCTNCGPRFTIVTDVPYDRPNTTMAGFAMCGDCAAEYHDPADRRFHAQPVCCPACGPRLSLRDPGGGELPGDPLEAARALLRSGGILAVKGLGGYHLAATAGDGTAVRALRSRKHREDKPFAVMTPDLGAARSLGAIGPVEEALLTGAARPVVLLRRRPGALLADAVAPGNPSIGVMLPYTPLHHLLVTTPLVMTSGNVSDEPIAHHDDDAFTRLAAIADAFLTHDRPIHVRTDDSVVRVFRGHALPIRRSRGHVPRPLPLATAQSVLACGAELKNTFCLAAAGRAFVSHHVGDLENYETLRAFRTGVEHFARLFGITPEVVAHDLHPEYLSTKYALDRDLPAVGVQHHHAHIASCLADNERTGPVIGVAFDGTGFGTDGTLWGGEFLVVDLAGFERAGHLRPVPLPGGAAAIREPWRMAAAYDVPDDLDVARRNAARWESVAAIGRGDVHAPPTSSAGRLFDAVAAVLGVRDRVTYEGQAAIELEHRADPGERGAYPVRVEETGAAFTVPAAEIVAAVVADLRAGVAVPVIAGRFHNAVAALVAAGAERVREATSLTTVALSGGVFQNMLLLERAVAALEESGFEVLVHRRVPPNDGGISLGQAAVAGARR